MKQKKAKLNYNLIIVAAVAVIVALMATIIILQSTKHIHEFGDWRRYKEPSCAEYGTDSRYCACGELQFRRVEKLEHTESDWVYDKEANEKRTVCLICDAVIKSESLADHVHSWSEWSSDKEATCTEQGISTRQCECGMIDTMYFAKKDHQFSDWFIAKPASCNANGSLERKCSECDKIEKESIPSLSHEDGKIIISSNEKRVFCLHCGTVIRVEIIPSSTGLEIENGVVIGIGECESADISIPSYHDGVKVTAIADKAFYKNSSISSIIIPETITEIGEKAFYGCKELKAIVIPDNVRTIGERAFAYCSQIESITLGVSIERLEMWIFEYCDKLASIHFNGTVEEWNSIEKNPYWDENTSNYTVYCIDGNINKR